MTNSRTSYLEAAQELDARRRARERLIAYCRYVYRGYADAWHLRVLTDHLEAVERGEIDRLIITEPPRHGKSLTASELFPGWFLGRNPDKRIILTSYALPLARKFSRSTRNIIDGKRYRNVFPGVNLAVDSKAADQWNVENRLGGLIAAGVGGGITGHGADLLIVDDPFKDDTEAESEVVRQSVWDWYTATAYSRLHPGGAVLVIATRWHEDDLIGRLIANAGDDADRWTILHLPAIWEPEIEEFHDEWRALGHNVVKPDELAEGQALWPERYSVEALHRIRANILSLNWHRLYQGTPIAPQGAMFKREWFEITQAVPAIGQRVRFWDLAGTEDDGAYTVGLLMVRTLDSLFWIEDIVRGQWAEHARDNIISQTAELDRSKYGFGVQIVIEQEPGSSGKSVIAYLTRRLAGYLVKGVPATGDKVLRSGPLASQAGAGNVRMLRATWNKAFLDEAASFPKGKYKDQIDAASGAFTELAKVSRAGQSQLLR